MFIDLRVHPYRREIGHPEQVGSGLDGAALDDVTLRNDAGGFREDGRDRRHFLHRFEFSDLRVVQVEEQEPLARAAQGRLRETERAFRPRRILRRSRCQRQEVVALRLDQLGAVDGEERVALLDLLADRLDEEFFDPAADLEVDRAEPRLVVFHPTHGTNRLLHGLSSTAPERTPINCRRRVDGDVRPSTSESARADRPSSEPTACCNRTVARSVRRVARCIGQCTLWPQWIRSPATRLARTRRPRHDRPAAMPTIRTSTSDQRADACRRSQCRRASSRSFMVFIL